MRSNLDRKLLVKKMHACIKRRKKCKAFVHRSQTRVTIFSLVGNDGPRDRMAGRRRVASRRITATSNNVIYRDDKFSIAVSRQVTAQNPLAFFPETRPRRRKEPSRPINHR